MARRTLTHLGNAACALGVIMLSACNKPAAMPASARSAKPEASSTPSARPSASATPSAAPATPKHDVVDSYFGVEVHDPYRWLEDAGAPAVGQWIAEQNAYTERVLGSFPGHEAIDKRVQELSLTSTQRFGPMLAASRLFYLQQTPPQPQPVLAWQPWPEGTPRVLVDPNSSGGTAITGVWPAPDGRYVAYGTAEGGSEATTIHVVRVADGSATPDSLPHAGGGTTPQGLAWDADGKGFVYVRLPLPGTVPDSELEFGAALYHHILGTQAKDDTLTFGKDLSPVAEYSFAVSDDGKHRAILVHFGDGDPDLVYLEHGSSWQRVLGAEANVRSGDASVVHGGAASWLGDKLLVISYQDAPRGKLLEVSENGRSRQLLAEQPWAMHSVFAIKKGFLLVMVQGPDWRVEQYDVQGRHVRTVPLPAQGTSIGDIASSDTSDQALIGISGWKVAGQWERYEAVGGSLNTVFQTTPSADYSRLRTHLVMAVSKDGTQVPVTVVSMEGVQPAGHRPAILMAYGGYGIAEGPRFLGPYLAWLERGGVYAVANIRGGGEFGEGWHEAGMLERKQNGFDDFYAAAEALKKSQWTDAAHLGILGGSNGGLLMGAELTQHPDAFRAVVSFVGIYDMLRAELWPNGRYNVSEYGTVKNKADFEWLYAYSPLQHVQAGIAYPAVLLETGENDPRVAPWQSRKFAAALQSATSSDRPVLLLTRMNAGHGVTASFSQRVGNTAAALTFFAHELDLPERR